MGYLKKLVEETLNGTNVYVKSLEIGGSYVRDYESSYFIHPRTQAKTALKTLNMTFLISSFMSFR